MISLDFVIFDNYFIMLDESFSSIVDDIKRYHYFIEKIHISFVFASFSKSFEMNYTFIQFIYLLDCLEFDKFGVTTHDIYLFFHHYKLEPDFSEDDD